MKRFTPLSILPGLFLLTCLFCQAQSTDSTATKKLAGYLANYKKFSNTYPQEKVYLHFDNTSYYLGENIWFKAYVVRADRNALSQLSKILYVELVSAEGYVLDTKKLKIENGQCHGDFKLNTTNYGGFYEIRAYTRYMLNFGEQNFFSRIFPVYDKPDNEGQYLPRITERAFSQRIPNKRPSNELKETVNLSFFPEGGSLVTGISSQVAFKASSKDGQNTVITGAVYNGKGEKVADLESGYLGMGVFTFTPGAETYYAKIQHNKQEYKFNLPQVLPSGYVMTVDNMDSCQINIQIEKNQATIARPLGLSVSCRGILYGFQVINPGNEEPTILSIPKSMLPSGLSQITLFNTEGKIESERLIFINHHSQMKIQVSAEKAQYAPFEKVSMSFDMKDKRENPVETTFSVAVRDAGTSPETVRGDNILTNLLLSSELKGYIENPGYYFESDSPLRRRSLDLLLMTQGWRRYEWQQMAGCTPFTVKHWLEKELTMDGYATSVIQKKKMKDADIKIVLYNDSISQRGTCKTDSVGTFNFALKDFYGDAKLILQSKRNEKLKEMYIRLNRQFSPPFKPYAYAETNLVQELKTGGNTGITLVQEDSLDNFLPEDNDKLAMDKRQHLLNAVTVKAKRKSVKININYNVEKEMDKIIDTNNWEPTDIGMLLEKTNKLIAYNICYWKDPVTGDSIASFCCSYKGKDVVFIRDYTKLRSPGANSSFSANGNSQPGSIESNNGSNNQENNTSNYGNNMKSTYLSIEPPGCMTPGFPDIDQIESISIIEDPESIIRLFPDAIKHKRIVLAVAHIKKQYVKEPVGVRNTTFAGYSYVKEFYQQKYDNPAIPKENDYRRTLYWNPDVKTGKDGKATIEFYNNSSCKAMNVSAETVTQTGIIGGL